MKQGKAKGKLFSDEQSPGKMTPGILHGIPDEQNIEKQMGCMAGFLQLFDRHQIVAERRFYPSKRLHSSPAAASPSPSHLSNVSPTFSVKAAPPSPENHQLEKPSLPLPVFEVKDGVRTLWKLREAPRLSLDSRAVVDARGKLRVRQVHASPAALPGDQSDCSEAGEYKNRQCRSPSVVARLMGLEALPDAEVDDQLQRPELRRSASESRVARDFPQFNFQKPSPIFSNKLLREPKPEPSPASPVPPLQRKSFFDAVEFFPEPKRTASIFGDIEKRLRMRGIEGSSKDLETLKQILEALQLKGLLRTKPQKLPAVYQSQIVIMKPAAKPLHHRSVSPRRSEIIPPARTLRNLGHRSLRSPISSPSPVRRQSASQPDRRIPAVHSPRASPGRRGSHQMGSRSPNDRRQKTETSSKVRVCSPVEDDDISAFSDSSPANSDFESVRREEISRTGCSVLERCDELLHSIAAITSSAEQVTAADQQPSPVSVLDSSFLSECSAISPNFLKRSIVIKDQLADWDDDYGHVADVIRETDGCRSPAEQRHRFSKVSLLHRQLVFDIVTEIVGRKRNVTPWVAFTCGWACPLAGGESSLLPEVWEEVRWLREPVIAESVIDLTGKMVRQDMAAGAAGEQEWAVPGVELSEAVLHIERQLFKDIVADTIRELADLAGSRRPNSLPRRKLIF